jgi:thiamine pyrophosphate-dependent acetolactate synthase large subunit-like protein
LLDVGCGTGALTATVLSRAAPAGVVGVDRSASFLRDAPRDRRAAFAAGDAAALPVAGGRFEVVVSGLALNFVGGPERAAAELARVAEEAPSGRTPVHPARYVVEATKAFAELDDGIMVRDGGATTIFGWTYSQAKPHDVIWNQNFGHLGTGLPYAVGASVADGGKRPVMLVTGDSSFQFQIAELETAARLNLPLVCVVAVDYAWGLEVGVYKRTFGHGSRETGVHWSKDTRLDKVAEGFGCYGEYVERDEDIAPAIKRAYASGRPGVIHVAVDPKANSEEMPSYDEFRTWYAEGMQ